MATQKIDLRRILCATLLFHIYWSPPVYASTETEYHLKAAFTFNFLKFTYFPDEKSMQTINLCLTSDTAAVPFFKTIENKKFDDILIVVREINADQFQDCDAVFLPSNNLESSRINVLKNLPVLTIGESNSFLKRGGMIQFFLEDGKMRFKISRKNAEANGIRFSSKLLRIAEVIGE